MKPLLIMNRVINSVSAASVALLIMALPVLSEANPLKGKGNGPVTEDKFSVQYSGSDASNYQFRVAFDNPSAEKFTLIIKNDDGVIVFQEQNSSVHFAKNVLLPKEELDIHPTFIIHTSNGDIKRSFSVSRKWTEDLVVTKL